MKPDDLDVRGEVGFYPFVGRKLIEGITDRCPRSDCRVVASSGPSLDAILRKIEKEAGRPTPFTGNHVPTVHPDILLGALDPSGFAGFCLVEVKYKDQLTLISYSQLLGYLLTIRLVGVGLLVLVTDDFTPASMSPELTSLLSDGDLPMQAAIQAGNSGTSIPLRTGIATYTPGDGIDFIKSPACGGLSNFGELASVLWPA